MIHTCALQTDLDILPGGDLTEIGEKVLITVILFLLTIKKHNNLFQNAKSCHGHTLFYLSFLLSTGLEIATDTVANATNIFSLATKNSSLVAKVATRFLYDLDLK